MIKTTDVIIAGAGPSGCCAALCLEKLGLSVCVLEGRTAPVYKDMRTTAIATACMRLYARLGMTERLLRTASPIKRITITNPHSIHRRGPSLLFDPQDVLEDQGDPLGWVIPNQTLQHSSHSMLGEKNIPILWGKTVVGIHHSHEKVELVCADGERLHARLVVAADGRFSTLRRLCAIPSWHKTYTQCALTGTVRHSLPHRGTAYEIFLRSGPLAALPMQNDCSSFIWTLPKETGTALHTTEASALACLLEERLRRYLGRIRLEGDSALFPLGAHLCKIFTAPRLLLLGDAAHSMHPIAGQGFNLAIGDCAILYDVMLRTLNSGADIGAAAALRSYGHSRRPACVTMVKAGDFFNGLFSNEYPVLSPLRRHGLRLARHIRPLRVGAMRFAGAQAGYVPQLMQRLNSAETAF